MSLHCVECSVSGIPNRFLRFIYGFEGIFWREQLADPPKKCDHILMVGGERRREGGSACRSLSRTEPSCFKPNNFDVT